MRSRLIKYQVTIPSASQTMVIDVSPRYFEKIDWGDGSIDASVTEMVQHTYSTPGTYTVEVIGSALRLKIGGLNGGFITSILDMPLTGMTNMQETFKGCSSLATVPVIPSGVTNLYNAFYGCSSLTTPPVIPGGVTNMYSTFYGCSLLATAPVIPPGVDDMRLTFYGCSSLTTPPVVPGGVTNMYGTFYGCRSLATAPAIPSGVTNLSLAFRGCISFVTAPAIPSGVTNLSQAFFGCISLVTAPAIPSGVTNLYNAFYGCSSLTTPPVIPGGVTNMYGTFYGCSLLATAPVIPPGVDDMRLTFYGCSSLEAPPCIPSKAKNLSYMFYNCTGLMEIPSTIWPDFTQNEINIDGMFYGCRNARGTIPAAKLWERTDITWTATDAFKGCVNLDNYNEIPPSWGGVFAILKVTLTGCDDGRWSIDGGTTWIDSGRSAEITAAGTVTLTFKTVSGYTTPADQSITVAEGDRLTSTGAYAVSTGTLTVTITGCASGQWSIDGGTTWNNSGATQTLTPGGYTITYKSVSGYTAPADASVTITSGNASTATGAYAVSTGTLTVTITGCASGQWSVDGGTTWNNSGATQTLTPGSYTITYKSVSGYTAPANAGVTITSGNASTATGAYEVEAAPLANFAWEYTGTVPFYVDSVKGPHLYIPDNFSSYFPVTATLAGTYGGNALTQTATLSSSDIKTDSNGKAYVELSPQLTEGTFVKVTIAKDGYTTYDTSLDSVYDGYAGSWNCLTGDTLITMSDGTCKYLADMKEGDMVVSINQESGKVENVPVQRVDGTRTLSSYTAYVFDNGVIQSVVGRHRFYNIECKAFIYMNEWKRGEHARMADGTAPALISSFEMKKESIMWTIRNRNFSYVANGMFTGTRNAQPVTPFDKKGAMKCLHT